MAGPGLAGCCINPQVNCDHPRPWDGGLPSDAGFYQEDGGYRADRAAFFLPDGGPNDRACELLCCDVYTNACGINDAGLLNCYAGPVGGRAPPGLLALSAVDASAGSWVARMAELESAAVVAFEHLSDELVVHGLPQHAGQALIAAQEEVRHAHDVTRLALSVGHCPTRHAIRPTPVRSLEEVALDNAGEGCGRELLGSLINAHQAKTAANPLVRKTIANIANDERAHAGFSFELARALMPKLTVAQRRRAREAQERTLVQLGGDDVPEAARDTLGLMDGDELRAAVGRLLDHARI